MHGDEHVRRNRSQDRFIGTRDVPEPDNNQALLQCQTIATTLVMSFMHVLSGQTSDRASTPFSITSLHRFCTASTKKRTERAAHLKRK
jgi:hypothetical protein